MTVTLDQEGNPDDGPKNFLALTATCKEVRSETRAHIRDVEDVLILPNLKASNNSLSEAIDRPFDPRHCLLSLVGFPHMRPRIVTLHIANLDVGADWKKEAQELIRCVPRRFHATQKLYKFLVRLQLVGGVVRPMSFCFPVSSKWSEDSADTRERAKNVVVPTINHHKALLRTAVNEEWRALEPGALARERALQWNRLHVLQHRLIELFTDSVARGF